MVCGFTSAYDCIKAFSKTDFPKDLKKMDGAMLMLHGDGQVVPIGTGAPKSSEPVPKGRLKI